MLRIKGLNSRYGRIQVLHDIDFHVDTGEIVTLVGSNGAGKTTLLRALSGTQPTMSGTVLLEGRDITAVAAHRRVRLGLVQVPEGRQIFTPLTVEENLKVGAWTRRDSITSDIEEIFMTFPILAEFRARPAGMLSGGQQQMLAIGRAMIARPRVLLLDEPSMGLAPLLIEQILQIICQLRDMGVTILVVEQNVQAALAIADRGYVIETGKISFSGTGAELLRDPRVHDSFLGGV
ncbi:MAG: ABC transporter ATP-binding protein [Xanthobacteraceae bacterium]